MTGAVLIVLWIFPAVEQRIDRVSDTRTYEIICPYTPEIFAEIENGFRLCGLRVRHHRQVKSGEDIVCTWEVYGPPDRHEQAVKGLFDHKAVKEFRF